MMNSAAVMGMGLLLAVSAPVGGDQTLWAQWGLAGLVVACTLWRDHHRERRMSAAIEADHKWVRETLVGVLEKNTAVVEKMLAKLEED